jgi:hypothetical protein
MASHKESAWKEVEDDYMIDGTAIQVTPRFLAYLIYFIRYEVLLPEAFKSAKSKKPLTGVPKVEVEVARLIVDINAAIADCTMEQYMENGNKVLPFKDA